MKIPAILLATITAAVVISSCTKSVDTTPSDYNPSDTTRGGGEHNPDYCPACGLG